jgi:hypothetical protein
MNKRRECVRVNAQWIGARCAECNRGLDVRKQKYIDAGTQVHCYRDGWFCAAHCPECNVQSKLEMVEAERDNRIER